MSGQVVHFAERPYSIFGREELWYPICCDEAVEEHEITSNIEIVTCEGCVDKLARQVASALKGDVHGTDNGTRTLCGASIPAKTWNVKTTHRVLFITCPDCREKVWHE